MATAVPSPSPPLCIRVLFELGKGTLSLQQDAAFIGTAANGARECTCEGGPRQDHGTCPDGKSHVAIGSKNN